MPRPQLILLSRLPLPDKIAQCLGVFIRNPHCCQIAGPVTACQFHRVPPISLHAVSRLPRNKARRHHRALDTQLRQLPVKYESRRPRFITCPQMLGRAEPLDELADRILAVGNRSQAANLAIRLGYCYSYRFGMDIQTQKS